MNRIGKAWLLFLSIPAYAQTSGIPDSAPVLPLEPLVITAPRLKNKRIPKSINDIVLRALDPDLTRRYQRAGELLDATLGARKVTTRGSSQSGRGTSVRTEETVTDIQSRLRARETPAARFCWHCRKPLHARTDRCPFCGETQ